MMPSSSYSLGLFFIFLVAVIWSIASIVVQYLYTNQHFDSPFLLTYIGTSLFILLLISYFALERLFCCRRQDQDNASMIPWKRIQHSYQQLPPSASEAVSLDNVQIDFTDDTDKHLDDDTRRQAVTSSADSDIWTHQDHIKAALKIAPVWFVANWAYNSSLAYTSITSSTVLASTGSLFTFLFAVVCRDESFTCFKLLGVLLGVTGSILTGLHDVHSDSNDSGIPSEEYDETTATTAFPISNDATPSIMCVAGPSGTPHHVDLSQSHDAFAGHAVWGDALGLLSAIGYGMYAVMIRIQCPRDESKMSMQLLLGYIGLFNAIALSPIATYVLLKPSFASHSSEHDDGGNNNDDDGSATSAGLTWVVFGYLVAKGTLDNVLSDYLWARAVVLTSATVATVGLGLTIPLAFVSDWFMGHDNVISAQSIAGALSVLAGFILVNIGEKGDGGGGAIDEGTTFSAPSELTRTTTSTEPVTPSSSEILDDTTISQDGRPHNL